MNNNSNWIKTGSASLLIFAVSCSSDSDSDDPPPPVVPPSLSALNLAEDDTSLVFESVGVLVDEVTTNFDVDQVLNIEVLDYTSSALPFEITLLGAPTVTNGDPLVPPAVDNRAAVIEDFVVNSAINNPSATAGMSFRFVDGMGEARPLANGPGPDILILEVGPPVGAPVPGGFTSVGGDPFILQGVGTDSDKVASFGPDDYQLIQGSGIAAGMSFFATEPPGTPTTPIESLAELEAIDLVQIAVADLNLHAILVDLDSLGFAEGALVDELVIFSTGTMFGVDPSLIVGFVR